MTISEDWNSREYQDTIAGLVVNQVFTCTWTDLANGTDGTTILPVKGATLEGFIVRPDLMCSEVRATAIDNTNCKVHITWSSEAFANELKRANQVASWEEEIDVQAEEAVVDAYLDTDSGTTKAWLATWTGLGAGYTEDNKPDLVSHTSRMVFTTTLYGDAEYIYRIADNVNRINSDNFLKNYFTKRQNNVADDLPGSWNDQYKWLFQGCRMRRLRGDTWQYSFRFLYNPDEWGRVKHTDTAYLLTNQYETFNATELLEDMDREDPADDIAFR